MKNPFSPPKHEDTKYHKNDLIDFHYFVGFSVLVILWHFILFGFSEWIHVYNLVFVFLFKFMKVC